MKPQKVRVWREWDDTMDRWVWRFSFINDDGTPAGPGATLSWCYALAAAELTYVERYGVTAEQVERLTTA